MAVPDDNEKLQSEHQTLLYTLTLYNTRDTVGVTILWSDSLNKCSPLTPIE